MQSGREETMKNRLMTALLCLALVSALGGCGKAEEGKEERGKNWDYTVVTTADCPADFLTEITKKKLNEFQMTYEDGENLYMAVGYGEQATGGYSIRVQGLYEKGDGLCLETSLIGPGEDVVVSNQPSYPYIVIKTELTDKKVEFV